MAVISRMWSGPVLCDQPLGLKLGRGGGRGRGFVVEGIVSPSPQYDSGELFVSYFECGN